MLELSMSEALEIAPNFQRFLDAQEPVFSSVIAELGAGRKRTHWMWFIFPQIIGLGRSSTANHYAIRSLTDAGHYLKHPILGPRLVQCTELVLQHTQTRIGDIFGFPDDLKFHSSMTLFAKVAPEQPCFQRALSAFFNDQFDERTLALT